MTTATETSTAAPIEEVVSAACRAPSVHNTQPWRWRLRGNHIDLYADYTRQLMQADPDRRDLLVSCGAVLHHLQVAAAGHGWSTRVRRLPDPTDERHVASITLRPDRISPDVADDLAALSVRRTDRRRFSSWPVPPERLQTLAAAGATWGAQVLPVPGEEVRAALHRLTAKADRTQRFDDRYVAELAAWTGARHRDGVPAGNIPERATATEPEDATNRRFPTGALADPTLEEKPSSEGMLIVCTSSDDTISRVRAGETLSAVWLRAVREDLSVVPLSQAVEVDATREEIRGGVLGGLAFPQILLRVGWASTARTPVGSTPRRPLGQLLVRD